MATSLSEDVFDIYYINVINHMTASVKLFNGNLFQWI